MKHRNKKEIKKKNEIRGADVTYQYFAEERKNKKETKSDLEKIEEKILNQYLYRFFSIFQPSFSFFTVWVVLFCIAFIYLFFHHSYSYAFASIFLAFLFFRSKKKITISYKDNLMRYTHNMMVTTRAFLEQWKYMNPFLDYSKQWFITFSFIQIVNHFVFSWFLWNAVTGLLYAISFYGILGTSILLFVKKEHLFLYQGLTFYHVFLGINVIGNILLYKQLNYFTIATAWIVLVAAIFVATFVLFEKTKEE